MDIKIVSAHNMGEDKLHIEGQVTLTIPATAEGHVSALENYYPPDQYYTDPEAVDKYGNKLLGHLIVNGVGGAKEDAASRPMTKEESRAYCVQQLLAALPVKPIEDAPVPVDLGLSDE